MPFSVSVISTVLVIRSSILPAPDSSTFARNPIASYNLVASPSLGD